MRSTRYDISIVVCALRYSRRRDQAISIYTNTWSAPNKKEYFNRCGEGAQNPESDEVDDIAILMERRASLVTSKIDGPHKTLDI